MGLDRDATGCLRFSLLAGDGRPYDEPVQLRHILNLSTSAPESLRPAGIIRVSAIVPLAQLRPGESGRVLDLPGNSALAARFAEMGLREGVSIRMIRSGQPCLVALGEQRLSFRGGDSDDILVEVD